MTPRPVVSCIRLANATVFALALLAPAIAAAEHTLGISQVYSVSGGVGAPYRYDYVEILNRGEAAVSLAGKSIQYSSATGSGLFSTNPITALAGTLEPGQYYLVRMASGGGFGDELPVTPDAIGVVNLAVAGAKIVLVDATAGLPCNGGSVPCGADDLARIIDLVGYGTANFFEGAAAPAPVLTEAIFRNAGGCVDTDNNAADFARAAALPRNSASPLNSCAFEVSCPATLTTLQGTAASALLTALDRSGTVSAATVVGEAAAGIELTGFTPAGDIGQSASVTLAVGGGTPAGSYPVEISFTSGTRAKSCTVQVEVGASQPGRARIHHIQGASHRSPLTGQAVSNVPGIVTALRTNGFYLQESEPDADPATSEGIFVFAQNAPAVAVGDSLLVSGTVTEFRPGNDESNLTVTNLGAASITLLSRGNPLPAATVIGLGGRLPPAATIDSGNCGDVEAPGCTFDPANDGIDFYESLEGMRVQLDNALAVGPTNAFGETPVVGDFGSAATQKTPRGGVYVSPADFNPERVILDDQIVSPVPQAGVGDGLGTVVGVLDYSFGNFKLQLTQAPAVSANAPARESAAPQDSAELAIAAINLENLSGVSPPERFSALAEQIAKNLSAPDILAVSELQDNNGATNDAEVDASKTYAALISAIANAGGPIYHFRSIDPVDDQDGGQPGANIRVGFLFNPARVAFVDRGAGGPTTATKVVNVDGAAKLSASPGRIDPENAAFFQSRKPLAGEFLFNGHSVFVIANHFNSKGGDSALFGRYQAPVLVTQDQRNQQAAVVRDFVRSILAVDASANVVVLGDLNDYHFSSTLDILKGAPLNDLGAQLSDNDRYTYVFEGNSQTLDHILVSDNLAAAARYDIVHVNAEYADRASDHDPVIAKLYLPARDVTADTASQISGLVYSRVTQRFNGSVRVSNASTDTIDGPIQVQLVGLPSDVGLANQSGTLDGMPYITYSLPLAPNETVSIPLMFTNPSRATISYSIRVYSGNF